MINNFCKSLMHSKKSNSDSYNQGNSSNDNSSSNSSLNSYTTNSSNKNYENYSNLNLSGSNSNSSSSSNFSENNKTSNSNNAECEDDDGYTNERLEIPSNNASRRSLSTCRNIFQNFSLNQRSKSCNNASTTKSVKKSPQKILRQPISYTYLRGMSGLPTQRVPRSSVCCQYH